MRSAADNDDVGWPEPACVLHRMESTRSCAAKLPMTPACAAVIGTGSCP
jgi:hypothetical protein